MPTLSSLLNSSLETVPDVETNALCDLRLKMIYVLNNLIELAIKQKKENLFFVEAISLAAYDLDREDPIISNQGNLMLQEDERINSLDRELMLNLARRYKGSHRLGIFILIMTETEENDQAGYINLEERTSMLTPVDDRNVNKFVDKYLDGVKYHRLKYTLAVKCSQYHAHHFRTKRTRQIFILWSPPKPDLVGVKSTHRCERLLKYLIVCIFIALSLFLLFVCREKVLSIFERILH